MFKYILKLTASIGAAILLSSTPGNAQVVKSVDVTIPFAFQVSDKSFAAGDYMIGQPSSQSSNRTISIRRKDGKYSGMLQLLPPAAGERSHADATSLVFRRYGTVFMLSEVRLRIIDLTGRLRRSETESSLARRFGEPEMRIVRGQ